ncbi:MAG: hypothetical protein JXX14_04920 [Deltaproteobacteria bacterium]|nr:hypothetical protein [Deltaproteobacteria bacterium]
MITKRMWMFLVGIVWFGCADDGTLTDDDSHHDPNTDTATDTATMLNVTATDDHEDTGGATDGECAVHGDGLSSLQFVNQCGDVLTFKGSDIESGMLPPGQSDCRHLGSEVAPISSIRFWGYIGPDPGGEHHTLAEMTLNTDFYDFDWYNISHVDAFNLPMAIVPLEMSDCPTKSCPDDLLPDCPEIGQFLIDGNLVSCVSPDRNNPDSVVARYFDEGCTEAYSWSGDDADSMAACAGEDYAIVFCP